MQRGGFRDTIKYIFPFRNKTGPSRVNRVKGDESMLIFTSMAEPREPDGSELIESRLRMLAEGDSAAMEQIYELTRTAVYAYALSLLKNSFDAEDVMHDCYLRLYASAGAYDPRGKPMAYILRIVRNLCRDRLAERARRAEVTEEEWGSLLRTDDIPSSLQAAEWMSILRDDERQIVLLHAVAGFRHRETASFMGMPLSTVLSKYSRAIKKLRKHITEREDRI